MHVIYDSVTPYVSLVPEAANVDHFYPAFMRWDCQQLLFLAIHFWIPN